MVQNLHIVPCVDSALSIEVAQEVSYEALETVHRLYKLFVVARLHGVREYVPAWTTLTLVVDPACWESVFQKVQAILAECEFTEECHLRTIHTQQQERRIDVPVCYDDEFAPDLETVAARQCLTKKDIVRLHTEAEYRVGMIGFVPGFPYLLGLPRVLATPRKSSPRLSVEAGSVGIAGEYTGIYPYATPGGWNIIGRTPLQLFSPHTEQLSLFRVGDRVRFYAISREEFASIEHTYSHILSEQKQNVCSADAKSIAPRTPCMTVLESRFRATLQDAGRHGYRQYGVPEGGAVDIRAMQIANMLVGNMRNEVVIEILWGGLVLSIDQELVCAFTGADVTIEAHHPTSHGVGIQRIPMNTPVVIQAGSVLRINPASSGVYAYCAVRGGIDVEIVLGSGSTYETARIGGIKGRALHAGDVIYVRNPMLCKQSVMRSYRASAVLPKYIPESRNYAISNKAPIRLRIIQGQDWGKVTDVGRQILLRERFYVLPRANAMGVCIASCSGQRLVVHTDNAMVSRAVMPGTIQLPPDGCPIILGREAQTTGGYPVIAHVCSVDMPRVAQARPFQELVFEEISLQTAQKLYIEEVHRLAELEQRIQRWLRAAMLL
ncbi:MAG: 5-oxoprolinase subunit PxpB [Bacteroidota bacterium]|nr:5-oxoprolinase subunit PxpB [Candidatus Kapabacteria bacterium]MDW8220981.1 5-oxoprolinase subunit PxpB [Bacteroidota bacterium]